MTIKSQIIARLEIAYTWDEMSIEEQREYIKKHPNSKLTPGHKKPKEVNREDRERRIKERVRKAKPRTQEEQREIEERHRDLRAEKNIRKGRTPERRKS